MPFSKFDITTIGDSYVEFLALDSDSPKTENLETFKDFLTTNKIPTDHASEIYAFMKDPTHILNLEHDLEINKKKTRWIRKKIGLPSAIGLAGLLSIIASLFIFKMPAGSTFLGIPVLSSQAGVWSTFAICTTILTSVLTPIIINAKNIITNVTYKKAKGTANSIIDKLNKGEVIDDLSFIKMLETTQKRTEKIISLSESKNPLRKIQKWFLNKVNRNNVHHIEAVTRDLATRLQQINSNAELTDEDKSIASAPILKILERVNGFVAKDIQVSKLHAMMTEHDESNTKAKIENIDIYANLENCLRLIAEGNKPGRTQKRGTNPSAKLRTANELYTDGLSSALKDIVGEPSVFEISSKLADILSSSGGGKHTKTETIDKSETVNNEIEKIYDAFKSELEDCTNEQLNEAKSQIKRFIDALSDGTLSYNSPRTYFKNAGFDASAISDEDILSISNRFLEAIDSKLASLPKDETIAKFESTIEDFKTVVTRHKAGFIDDEDMIEILKSANITNSEIISDNIDEITVSTLNSLSQYIEEYKTGNQVYRTFINTFFENLDEEIGSRSVAFDEAFDEFFGDYFNPDDTSVDDNLPPS